MPIGINNVTQVTMHNLTQLGNITDPMEFYINVNQIIYGGVLIFVTLWIMMFIIFLALQKAQDQPLINTMYAAGVVSVLSFFYRAILIVRDGVVVGLLTDNQMWIFPLIAAIAGATIWYMKDR